MEEVQSELTPHEQLTRAVAENIAALRASRKMTQLELGEALNYSDKAISKWERAEAVPDAYVLSDMASIFDVSVDWILTKHEKSELPPRRSDHVARVRRAVTTLSFFGVWTLATLIFVTLAIVDIREWQVFIYTIPISLIVLIVFNSMWGRPRRNYLIITVLVWTLLLAIFLTVDLPLKWMLFLLGIPAEIIIFLWSRLSK